MSLTRSDFHPGTPPRFNVPPRAVLSPWLSALGIVGIVIGVLGVMTYHVCGAGGMVAIMLFGDSIPEVLRANLPDDRWKAIGLTLNLVNGFVSLLLLIASILVMRMSPLGPRLYRVWANIRIIAVLASAPVNYAMQMHQMESLGAQATGGVDMAAMATPFAIFWVILMFGWGMLLPVFALIWLQRRAVRDEIAQWSVGRKNDGEIVYP